MQYKLLASDYDNTLVPFGEGVPRAAVVQAIQKMQAAGGRFVLSTGRSWSAVKGKSQLGGIRFDYAITCNGACVVDRTGRIVSEHPMTAEEMYALVDFCEDYNYPLQFDFRDERPGPGLPGRRRPGPPSGGYAPRRLCGAAPCGAGPV